MTEPPRKYRLGPDIDLDREPVYLADGTRLTEAHAQQLAEETLAEVRAAPRRQRTWPELRAELDFDAADEAAIAEHRARFDDVPE